MGLVAAGADRHRRARSSAGRAAPPQPVRPRAGCSGWAGCPSACGGCGTSPPPGGSIATIVYSGYIATACAVAPGGRWRRLGLPAAITVAEAIRWSFPFGGVPLASLAISQVGRPAGAGGARRRLPAADLGRAPGRHGAVGPLGAGLAAGAGRHRGGARRRAGGGHAGSPRSRHRHGARLVRAGGWPAGHARHRHRPARWSSSATSTPPSRSSPAPRTSCCGPRT